jgi:glyoxylase-like metal-dependent hydrolase (beta-lactamase superfamily II)
VKTAFTLPLAVACLWLFCTPAFANPPPAATRVFILDTGWLECDANWMVAMSVVGTKGNPHPQARWIKVPVYAVLIDHPEGKFLYDTGCSPTLRNDEHATFPCYHGENQTLVKQLSLAHTRPEEIKAVILSHMHGDHAGNIGLFKHAEVYVHKAEIEHAGASGVSTPLDPEMLAKRCHLVDNDRELARGIKLITLPGHSYGVLGLVVETKNDGVLIFPSDAVYTRANFGPPAKLSGIVYDSLSFFESIEKVRRLVKKHNAKVMFPHDMEFFKTLKLAPECYE